MHLNAYPDPINYEKSEFSIKRFGAIVDKIRLSSFLNWLEIKDKYEVWDLVLPSRISLTKDHASLFPLPFEKWIYADEETASYVKSSGVTGLTTIDVRNMYG